MLSIYKKELYPINETNRHLQIEGFVIFHYEFALIDKFLFIRKEQTTSKLTYKYLIIVS